MTGHLTTDYRATLLHTALLLACLTLPACSQLQRVAPTQTRTVRVPIRLVGNVPLVQAAVGGLEPEWFFLDTGSAVNVISARLAKRLSSLEWTDTALKVTDPGKQTSVLRRHTYARVALGEWAQPRAPFSVADLRWVAEGYGFEVGGILGIPLFGDTPFTLDYLNRELILDCDSLHAGMDGVLPVTLHKTRRDPLIQLRIGRRQVTAILDTGSTGGLDLPNALIRKLELSQPMVVVGKAGLFGGIVDDRSGRLSDDLVLGDQIVKSPVFSVEEQCARVGGEILRRLSLTIDMPRGLVRFERDSKAPIELPAVRSLGVGFKWSQGHWVVLFVLNSVPSAGRIQPGDRLVLVNGRPPTELEPGWTRALRQDSATLVLERDKRQYELVLPLVTLVP